MIKFPILNSLKYRPSGEGDLIRNYRNTLFPDLVRGVAQEFAGYPESCVIFKTFDSIYIQLEIADTWSASDVDILIFDELGNSYDYGNVQTPSGATSTLVASTDDSDIWLITIPLSNDYQNKLLYSYFVNAGEDEEYYSEWFYVKSALVDRDISRDILKIEYSNINGLKNGYYWSGETQTIKIDKSYYSDSDFDNKSEDVEGISGNTLRLDGYSLRTDEYTLLNIPFYMYEKIQYACNQLYLTINDKPMTLLNIDKISTSDGAISFKITFKEKDEVTHY